LHNLRYKLAALLLAGLLAACGADTNPVPTSAAPTAAPTVAAVTQPADVPVSQATATDAPRTDADTANLVARVNGQGITRAEYQRALNRRLTTAAAADSDRVADQVLDALIEQVLIEQAAPTLGVNVSPDDVQQAMATLRASAPTDADWQQFLALNGYDEDEMIEAQRQALITQRVRDALMADLSGSVSQVNARHILVLSEAAAQDVLTRLQAGEPFGQLAAEYSVDMTTAENGGDLGWFTAAELMDPRLAEIAFSLQPGEIAGPIPTRLGYHIIQTVEIAQRPIEPERLPLLMENNFVNWLGEQYRTAEIERFIE